MNQDQTKAQAACEDKGIESVATMTLICTTDGGMFLQIGGEGDALGILTELSECLNESVVDGTDTPTAPLVIDDSELLPPSDQFPNIDFDEGQTPIPLPDPNQPQDEDGDEDGEDYSFPQ